MESFAVSQVQTLKNFAFSEINSLAKIKTADLGEQKEGALRAAAQQFESMFVDMMLQGMREANKVFSEGSYLTSFETEMHQEMLDHQWSVHMAESGGLGLADVIYSQLSGEAGPQRRMEVNRLPMSDEQSVPEGLSLKSSGFKTEGFEEPAAFVAGLLPAIETALAGTTLSPIAVLAQGALETGWGRHVIHSEDGASTHNLFGIKADADWSGESVEVNTLEFIGGVRRELSERFRSYASWAEAISDYADFISNSPRYAEAMDNAEEPRQFVRELQKAGYATDPDYAAKINRVMDSKTFKDALDEL